MAASAMVQERFPEKQCEQVHSTEDLGTRLRSARQDFACDNASHLSI